MAKRKGKSKRRIKHWHNRYVAGEDSIDQASRRGKLSRRGVKLPPARLDAPEEYLAELPQRKGLVVNISRRGVYVRAEGEECFCGIAKTFRAPENSSALAVGDEVTVALARRDHTDGRTELDRERMDGFVVSRQPRQSALSRPQPMSQKRREEYDAGVFEKVIAANVDLLLIVAATREPPLSLGLIDRFLIAADRGELEPVLVLNKIDLAPPDARAVRELEVLDVEVLRCSAERGEGIEAVVAKLAKRRSVLAGASGVGKSTLLNRIIPDAEAATRTVRAKDSRGRHTTTSSVVYDLSAGGILIDTPGIRELGMALDPRELPWYFPEFEQLATACRFNDCTHTHEPDCAVIQAVEDRRVAPRRYASYLRMLESLERG
jgi:ribosome biogenesis GTPase